MSGDDILDRFLSEIGKGQAPLPTGDRTLDRLPVVLAIDRSGSTHQSGDIVQINGFLQRFADAIASPPNDGWRRIQAHLDLCIVAYADQAEEALPWTPGDQVTRAIIPTLTGAGVTSMAAGLELCATLMMRRLADYRTRQIACYRGYIFNVTDGNPTDMAPNDSDGAKADRWRRVKTVLDRFETISSQGSAYTWTFHAASRAANRDLLRQLAYTHDRVVDLEQADFDKLFEFIRVSLTKAVDEV